VLRRAAPYAAATLLLILAFSAVVHAYARSLIYPGSPVPFPPGAPVVSYTAADGQPLRGALVRSGREGAPAVLYFHGNAESAAQNLPLAELLAARGIDTFLAEYRGYGGLTGKPTEEGLLADAAAARRALGVPPERLVIVGRSLGTGPAVALATRERCAHLVLISPYTSLVDMGRLMVGPVASLLMPDRFDSLSLAPSLTFPVTIVHGTHDQVIPYAMGQRLAKAIPGARLVTLACGHNDIPGLPEILIAAAADRKS